MLSTLLILFASLLAPAHAAQQQPEFSTPVGVGGTVSENSDSRRYSLVVEAQNHFKQRRGLYGLRQYGHGESRLILGDGVGASLSATSGVTLLGLSDYDSRVVAPHLGIEPANGRIYWKSNSSVNSYAWLPMLSAGFQFQAGGCRALPTLRGGGAAGTLTRTGVSPAFGYSYGAGSYLNCSNVDIALEATFVSADQRSAILRVFDAAYRFSPQGLKIGMRGESELVKGISENRAMVVLRTELFQ